MSTSLTARPNTTCAPHVARDSAHDSRAWDGGTTALTESPLVTSDHPDREQLEELAYAMLDRIGSALDAVIQEDWNMTSIYLVAAVQFTNEMRAILGTEDGD